MFKKTIIVGLLLSSSAVNAADGKNSVEILVGKSDAGLTASGISFDGDDSLVGLRGSYFVGNNGYVELSFIDNGSFALSGTEFSTNDLSIGYKRVFPVNNKFSMVGRLGATFKGAEISDASGSAEDDGIGPYLGLGAEYNFTSKVFAGAEYTFSTADIDGVDVENKSLTFSLGYRF